MAISSTRRQRIVQFSTPKVADLVVVETKDASRHLKSADSADHADDDINETALLSRDKLPFAAPQFIFNIFSVLSCDIK